MGRRKVSVLTTVLDNSISYTVDNHITLERHEKDLQKLYENISNDVSEVVSELNNKTALLEEEDRRLLNLIDLQSELLKVTITKYIKTTKLFCIIDALLAISIIILIFIK